jgi:hypothetical protein
MPSPFCFSAFAAATVLAAASFSATAQVAPLAPRWIAGDPPPPVETFASGLERHQVPLTHQALIVALRDPNGEVRSLAAAQLAAMDDHPALPDINRALADERDPQVQVNLAGAATWLGSVHALDQLQTLCRDINVPPTIRLDAARYVSHKEVATCFSAVDQIERTDQNPDTRVLALQTASRYRGQSSKAQSLSVSALSDVEPSVRIAAADALSYLHAKSSIEALSHALQVEGDDTAREHIREAIRVLRLLPSEHD